MTKDLVRVGCASGFWGDSDDGAKQLLDHGGLDYLVFDYLSEVTMSLLARAQAKNPDHGYARDFVTPTMDNLLDRVAESGVRVLANAGGVNLPACRDALEALIAAKGLTLKVAIVLGDDLMSRLDELRVARVEPFDDGADTLPERVTSMNAYLGALPIVRALEMGADIVLTGRCADSALVLGPLMHSFGWSETEYDKLAAGSLAGHIVECGVQATGGNFTDWASVEGWENMGYPIIEMRGDGSFFVTKPEGTGGLISELTVGEQLLYELGDPRAYILPDVICDFSHVTLRQEGPDRVLVRGARGHPPTEFYKVSTTYHGGYRSTTMFTMIGPNNYAKVRRTGEAILARCRRLMSERGFGDFRRTDLKVLGAEDAYGAQARPEARASRELVLRLDVQHDEDAALKIFTREIAPAGLAMGPGRCSLVGGRPGVAPQVRLFTFLIGKSQLQPRVIVDEMEEEIVIPKGQPLTSAPPVVETTQDAAKAPDPDWSAQVPLLSLAVARSGDKGNIANIGVIARQPDYLPFIKTSLTPEAVKSYFAHFVEGRAERFDLPAMHALNFLLHDALDGGGTSSLRNDPLGKAFAQMLLDYPVNVPPDLARALT